MQIHELNTFNGELGSNTFVAVDNGQDTGKASISQVLADTNDTLDQLNERIDNIIAGPASSAEEVIDARLGADGKTYDSLGDAVRGQIELVEDFFSWEPKRLETTTLIANGGVLMATGRGVYIPVTAGKTYKISIKGEFNRFIVAGTDNIAANSAITVLYVEPAEVYNEKEFTYNADGSYSYLHISLAYNLGTYALNEAMAYVTDTANANSLKIMSSEAANISVTAGEEKYYCVPILRSNYIVNNNNVLSGGSTNLFDVVMKKPGNYHIVVEGTFNRFLIYKGKDFSIGAVVEQIYIESGSFTRKEYDYKFTGTNEHLIILANYPYVQDAAQVSVEYSNLLDDNEITVNGIQLYTKAGAGELVRAVTDGAYAKNIPGERYDDRLPDNYDVVIYSSYGCNFDVFPIKEPGFYKIAATGDFNRFGIYVGNSVEIGQTLTMLHFETAVGSPFADKEYNYESDGTYKYLAVVSNYPYNNDKSVVTCNYTTVEDANEIPVNGFEMYTKEGVENRLATYQADATEVLTNYISENTVSVVTTVAALYALYDQLVTDYPEFVTKTILGEDDFGFELRQYEFTSGNYNSITGYMRTKDAAINKPKIMIVSGIHGYERTSAVATYQFCLDLCQGNNNLLDLRGNYDIKVVPLGDPWSFENNTRANGNGVNIDDNFDVNWVKRNEGNWDFSGNAAADQPETQILQAWIEANTDAVLYIDYHNSGYQDEVSYVGGNNSANGMKKFKRLYLESMYKFMPYLELEEGFLTTLIYAYTGTFPWSSSYNYASSKGLTGACLEGSWNQNRSGQHSDLSIKTGAEILGNILRYFADNK